ncbi:TetR/AcrR family transcriptional regulator [Mycobacterium sp. 1423905.2]|uniref:TetR/AcrR family transcriptional regulator n=1 Tax=Mycobacterium sp. 1423905.2 TaxID=1856859 RepID=UPI0007FB79F1|nr:TetR/AcrR family transcriptional regulator [Mycobacterium sp. 1423905.2]OBJ58234.1 TetR family transcriptional regulator [Mycobacterium sp. 1423905.2]
MTTTGPVRSTRGRRSTRPSGDDRELAILATAERLLEQRPYAEISVDDLAKGAGLSRPTFYFYFPSKDAVLTALIDRVISEADRSADAALGGRDAGVDPARVWRSISALFATFGAHRPVTLAGATARASVPEIAARWSTFMEKWIDYTAESIESERDRGAAPNTIPARDLAISLNLMNERTMFAAFADEPSAVPAERTVDTLAHIWVSSIYGSGH